MPDSDPAAILDNLATQTWTTPDGEVTGKQAIDLLVWLSDKPTSTATSAEIAEHLGLPSASDRRCRRVVERLKERDLIEYDGRGKTWALTRAGVEVCVECNRRDRVERPEAPDAYCVSTPDGGCEGVGCMHDPTPPADAVPVDPCTARTMQRVYGMGTPEGPLLWAGPPYPPLPPRAALRVCPVCACVYHSRTRWCRGQNGYAHTAAHTHSIR